MVELGGFVSEKCRGVVAGMEASLARVESLSGTTALKMDENLRRIGEVSERMTMAGRAQIECFEKQMLQSMESFRVLVQTFQAETKAQAHAFVLKSARQWQWIGGAIVVCLLVGAGASFFSNRDKIQALTAFKENCKNEVSFFLKEAYNGRRVAVDKKGFCSAELNEQNFENHYR